MPWCPNCKSEYRDGFTTCVDCGIKLVDKLPQEKVQEEIATDSYFNYDEIINPTFLFSASYEIQCKIIENMLIESDIPCYSIDKGCGTYLKVYMGSTVFGTDIYVGEINYDKAKELLDVYLSELVDESEYEPLEEKDNRSFSFRKKGMRIIIIALILLPFFAWILSGSLAFIQNSIARIF